MKTFCRQAWSIFQTTRVALRGPDDKNFTSTKSRKTDDLYFCRDAQNPLHTFPCNFPVDGEVAKLLQSCCGLVSDRANKFATSWKQVVVMEFGNGHDTTDTTDFCPVPAPTCWLSGDAAVPRRTRDRKVAGSTPCRGAIKSTNSTQPSIPPE